MATKKMTLKKQIEYAQSTAIHHTLEATDNLRWMKMDWKRKMDFVKQQPKKERKAFMAELLHHKKCNEDRIKASELMAIKYGAIYNSLKQLEKITNR